MKTINRRSFVAALAASLSSAAAVPASGTETNSEHPDLLAMSDRLPAALQGYKDAEQRVKHIADTWGPKWPTPDPEIFWCGAKSKRHDDILGRGIKTQWGKGDAFRVHNIGTPEGFEIDHQKHMREAERKSKLKSQRGLKAELKWAEHCKARIEPARVYWSEVERIERESGIKEARAAKIAALEALFSLIGDILTFEEQSPLGFGIKAQALAAFTETPTCYQAMNVEFPSWFAGLTATLMRQASIP